MTKQEEPVTPKEQESGLAIVSMVLGIVSLTGPGMLLGIPAIITSSIALKKKLAGRGMAIAGLVTGIVSTVLSLLFCLFVVFLMLWGIAHPEEFNNSPNWRDGGSSAQQGEAPFSQSQT